MKKRFVIILSIAALAIVLSVAAVISRNFRKHDNEEDIPLASHSPTGSVVVNVPKVTEKPSESIVPIDYEDENEVLVTIPPETEEEKQQILPDVTEEPTETPEVIEIKTEDEVKTEKVVVKPEDKVEVVIKDETEDKGIDVDGDVINDIILDEKEKEETKKEEEDDKKNPVIAEPSETVSDDTEKEEVIVIEETPDDGKTEDEKTSTPEYVPQGPRPFKEPIEGNGGQVYNVEDLIGEDGLRPGEGIHF